MVKNSKKLLLLMVEDSEIDAGLILRRLRREGYNVDYERVETAEQMRAAVQKQPWDLIMADYSLPKFDAPSALAILRELGLDVPLIVVSGSIGEDKAVALMKAGADDFLLKENLAHLGAAVERNLRAALERRARRAAEKALRESEQRFRSLFETSLDGMMVTVADGKVLSANARMCEILGMTEEEIVGAGRAGIVVQDERLAAGLEERARTGKFLGELTFCRKDGSFVPVELSSNVFQDFDGTLKTCQVVRDVTERKYTEAALQRGRDEMERRVEERTAMVQWQAELLDLAHDALIVWNDGGRISFWSSGAEATYGYSKHEAMGKNIHLLLSTKYPAPLEQIIEMAERDGRWEGELSQTCKQGRQIVVLSRWASRHGMTGGSIEILEVNTDITSRKRAEEALRMAGAYNRRLIEASLDPLVTIDSTGKINDVNKATEGVTGRSRETLIGTDFVNYFTDSRKARAGYRRVFEQGFVRDYELEIRHADGHLIPVLYNATVFQDDAGQVVGVFAAARDITGRKRAEREILDKSHALEELNTALKVLLDYRKSDRQEFEETILSNVRNRVVPYIEKLKRTKLDGGQSALVEIVERALHDLTSPFLRNFASEHSHLTPKELEIANLIKEGKTTKEIAEVLGIGKRTVDSYRDRIRSKLKIADKKVNLRTYLLSISGTVTNTV